MLWGKTEGSEVFCVKVKEKGIGGKAVFFLNLLWFWGCPSIQAVYTMQAAEWVSKTRSYGK